MALLRAGGARPCGRRANLLGQRRVSLLRSALRQRPEPAGVARVRLSSRPPVAGSPTPQTRVPLRSPPNPSRRCVPCGRRTTRPLRQRLLSDRRDELTPERTRVVNRLHRLLRELRPGGGPSRLSVSDRVGGAPDAACVRRALARPVASKSDPADAVPLRSPPNPSRRCVPCGRRTTRRCCRTRHGGRACELRRRASMETAWAPRLLMYRLHPYGKPSQTSSLRTAPRLVPARAPRGRRCAP